LVKNGRLPGARGGNMSAGTARTAPFTTSTTPSAGVRNSRTTRSIVSNRLQAMHGTNFVCPPSSKNTTDCSMPAPSLFLVKRTTAHFKFIQRELRPVQVRPPGRLNVIRVDIGDARPDRQMLQPVQGERQNCAPHSPAAVHR